MAVEHTALAWYFAAGAWLVITVVLVAG